MRSAVILIAALISGGFAFPALADCDRPSPAPSVPSGVTATVAAMTAGHTAVQAYVNALEAYQACLEKEIAAATADTKPEMKGAWRAQADAAVDEAHSVAQSYSDQLKIYKARQQPQ